MPPLKHVKDGVELQLQPVMIDALMTIAGVFAKHNVDLVVTAGTDGTHMVGSKHYTGNAVDLRSRHLIVVQKALILSDMKQALGNDFDCLLEGDHFHVEYDPK